MSEQQSPTSPTDTAEQVEFGGIHLLIGFVIGAALQFGWWTLIDRLSLRTVDPSNNGFLVQLLALLDQTQRAGFFFGAILGAVANLKSASPLRSIIGKAIRWSFGFAIAFYLLDVVQLLLQISLGKSLGDIVNAAILFGICGTTIGFLLVWKQTTPAERKTIFTLKQFIRWTTALDRFSVQLVLLVTLLSALLGMAIEMLLKGLTVWLLMIVPIVVVAVMAFRVWRPSRKTMRRWLSGALVAIVIFDLLALLALNAMLGTLAGIAVLVGYAIIQSHK